MFIVYFSKMAKKRKNVGANSAQAKKTRNKSKSTEEEPEKCASSHRSKSPGSVSSESPSLESIAGKFTV